MQPEVEVADLTRLLASESAPERVLQTVSNALARLVPHDGFAFYSADASNRLLDPVLVRNPASGPVPADPIPYGEGPIGSAAESGRSRLVPWNTSPPDGSGGTTPHSLIVNLLEARGELKGVLCLYRVDPEKAFTDEEFQRAVGFSEPAALALDNALVRSALESEATTDVLTGLHNRRYFEERLLQEVSRAMRRRTSVSLLIFDIDDFKDVNDEYGHLLGDRVLQGVASEVERISRVEDPVCRIGGEEFAVILLGQSASDAQLFAERIRHTVTALSFPMDTHVTVSVGLAEVPANASTPRNLFACADLALRTAKAEGKNRVCAYAGRTLGFRWDASNDYPLAGRWQILARGVGGGAGRAGRSIGHMETIASLTSRLTRAQDVAATAGAIRDELESLATYRSCSVYVLAGDGTTLISAIPPRNPRARGRGRVSALRRATAEDAVRLGDIIHVPGESSPSPADGRGHSLVATPLRFEDRVIGVLVVSRLEGGAFDHDDARLLSAVGSIAAIALQNARLAEAQRDTGRNLDGAYPSTGIAVSGQP